MTIKKVREGPEVRIKFECRGCEYLEITVGMCSLWVECHDKAWKYGRDIPHGAPIHTPDKCRFKKKALKEFTKKTK